MARISVESIFEISDELVSQLIEMLNNDIKLQEALGSNRSISMREFCEYNKEWTTKTNSDMFAIILDGVAIGSISLSHQNKEELSARIGYWIGSNHWGRGYTTNAFTLMMDLARDKGIKHLSASIKEDVIASKKIWEKFGADIELKEGRFNASIEL